MKIGRLGLILAILASSILLIYSSYWFTPVSCGGIIEDELRKAIQQPAGQGDVREWVKRNYPLGSWWFIQEQRESVNIASWRSWDKRYHWIESDTGISIRKLWLYRNLTIGDVLRCFGEPESYAWSSDFVADAFDAYFVMSYPKQGFLITLESIITREQPVITKGSTIGALVILPSTTVDKMLQDAYPHVMYGSLESEFAQNIHSWPDDFHEIPLTLTIFDH